MLSFTLVPVLFKYLVKPHPTHESAGPKARKIRNPFSAIHHGFEHGFSRFREGYRSALAWIVTRPLAPCVFFVLLAIGTWFPLQALGMDFFPADRCWTDASARAGAAWHAARADPGLFRQG